METPEFLVGNDRGERQSTPTVDVADAVAQFQQFHQIASKRDSFVDTDTKLVAIAGQLAVIFSVLTNALQRRTI